MTNVLIPELQTPESLIGETQSIEFFRQFFTDPILRRICLKMGEGYKRSSDRFQEYRYASKETRGNDRRGVIEDIFQDFGNFEPSVKVNNYPYDAKKSGHYTALQCGPVILTFSKTENENALPRAAIFRETIAQGSEFLFEDDTLRNATTPVLHAILTHRPAQGDLKGQVPKFITIGIPDRSYRSFVAKISLHSIFANDFVDEVVQEEAKPKLRIKRQIEEKQA
jgi:hypothetical protein